jgi:NADPH-dependent 2,4-dienoyl-CoA reductase/sulfur reductase-like enzyme
MKICIIGGGASARTAAGRVRRLDRQAQINLFSKQTEIGYAPCEPPFVLRGRIGRWDDIFYPGKYFEERNIDVHLDTEVTDIDRENKRIIAGGESYPYDKAVLCLGTTPFIPPIPGMDGKNEFTVSTNIADDKAIEKIIPSYTSAAVIGAGAIGIEMCLALVARGYHPVYLLDMLENILPVSLDKDMADTVEQVMREKGIDLVMPAGINGIKTLSGRKHIMLPDRELDVDFIVLATGARPNVELARNAGIRIGETGGIAVNQYLQTSDPDIYAAGDCIENWSILTGDKIRNLMVTTAGITGDIAGRNVISENPLPYRGALMTFVIDIFDHQIGTVGLTEKAAREKGLDVGSAATTALTARPLYGGKPIHYKLIGDRKSRTLVGAQVISEHEIQGIINELAVIAAERIPLANLMAIDFPYSPLIGQETVVEAIARLLPQLKTSK